MMKEIKTGMRLIRYSYGLKWIVLFIIFFILIGIGLQLPPQSLFWLFGGYFLLINAMFPTQLVYTLSVSNMIQVSPYKKALQTSIPTIVNVSGTLIFYVVFIIINGIRVLKHYETAAAVSNCIIWLSLLVFVVIIYNSFTYKYYVASCMGVFLFVYVGMKVAMMESAKNTFTFDKLGFVPAALIGLVILLLGGILEYLSALLVYKAPIAKMSQMASLRKYM